MIGHPAFAALGRTVETSVNINDVCRVSFPTTITRVEVNGHGVVTFVVDMFDWGSGSIVKTRRAPHEVRFVDG